MTTTWRSRRGRSRAVSRCSVGDRTVEVREPIGLGHKVALADIAVGEPVRKYGQIIGFASKAIAAGSLVHVNNLSADLFERDYAYATEHPEIRRAGSRSAPFEGYLRPDGRVGPGITSPSSAR